VERLPEEHAAPSPEAQGHALSDLNRPYRAEAISIRPWMKP
jgi:hypothetical protein